MEVEYFIVNHDDCIAIVYRHNTLGRIVVVRGNLDFNFNLQIHSPKGGEVENKDMLEFLLSTIPSKLEN